MRIAIYGIAIGFATAVAAMALPLAHPHAPIIVWRCIFWSGIGIAILGWGLLIFEIVRANARKQKTTPILTMVGGALVFIVGAIWYFSFSPMASAQAQQSSPPPTTQSAPNPTPAKPAVPVPPITVNGGSPGISVNQSGGVTAGTYVNQAPKPELKTVSEHWTDNPNGTQTYVRIMKMNAP